MIEKAMLYSNDPENIVGVRSDGIELRILVSTPELGREVMDFIRDLSTRHPISVKYGNLSWTHFNYTRDILSKYMMGKLK